MAIATWWYGDARPTFAALQEFEVERYPDVRLVARVNRISTEEVRRRLGTGHRAFVGFLSKSPAAYGWMATEQADVGEVRLVFRLPHQNAYLWDFGTVEPNRGLGLYPRLLDAIREAETPRFTRLWIIHSPENGPSARGIQAAGFECVGDLSFDIDSRVRLRPQGRPERSIAAAHLLGVELTERVLSECWTCETSTRCECRDASHMRCACHISPLPRAHLVIRGR